MSIKIVVETSLNCARRILSVWLIALAVGWPVAAVAGPGEDLVAAADRGDAAAVQALLAKGAEINAKANNGTTALYMASQNGHRDVVQALLAKGAEVNAKTNNGMTALDAAKKGGHADVRALLMKGSAKP